MSASVKTTVSKDELAILFHFFFLAWAHNHGGARVTVALLQGLYSGRRVPFELTELRCLDAYVDENGVRRRIALRVASYAMASNCVKGFDDSARFISCVRA